MPGFLDHVLPIFLWGMNAGGKIELVKIFSQLSEIFRARRFRQLADRAELFKIVFAKICARLTQAVQFKERLMFHIQRADCLVRDLRIR